MGEVKITDLVPQETIDKVKKLDTEIKGLLTTYLDTARDLAKGLEINVKVVGDIDKLQEVFVKNAREATATNERLNAVFGEQEKIIANTTNTTSRLKMEQERLNKATRQEYSDAQKVKEMLEPVIESYENKTKMMAKLKLQIDANKESQKKLDEQYKKNIISEDTYIERQSKLIAQSRELAVQKSNLSQVMKIEEKMNQENESSYNHLSQQLELLKKTYKQLSEAQKDTEVGKAMEHSIQELDAHLKDLAADMGEFQRNVGNYAIAGQNGVVNIESLMVALKQQAVTIKDVSDQSKLLTEARGMLDTSDERYAETVGLINDKLAENSLRLSDVSDIMDVQAKTAAEAEEQNIRLKEAMKLVDQTGEDAQRTIDELNAKIKENNLIIEAGSESKASLKKDLKELVLDIANLSIEYQNLSEEEKASAQGKELAAYIQELTERAGKLKDAISDTNTAISNAASDTRGFDQLGGALQLAIDGFGLAQGAAAMLGISEGELAEIQTKLQAAIAASNAMQSIQNTLQKESAVMQGVALAQTRLRTIAENLHTASQGRGVIATKALTAAQWAFNAAASANPIGLLIVAVVAAIAAIWGLTKAFSAFFSPSQKAIEQCKSMKESLDEMSEAYDRNTERMKARGATEEELMTRSIKHNSEFKDAITEYFEAISKVYKKDTEEYKEAEEAKKKADDDYKQSLEDGYLFFVKLMKDTSAKERENAIGTLAYKIEIIEEEKKRQLELAETLLANGKIVQETYEKIVASVNKAAEFKVKDATEAEQKKTKSISGAGRSVDEAKKQAEELKKEVQAGEDALLKVIEDSLERQRKAEELSYSRQLKELKDKLAKTKDTQAELRTALNRQIEGLTAEHNRKIEELDEARKVRTLKTEADIIASRLETVEKGSDEELALKKRSLENQMQTELLAVLQSERNKTMTVEQAEEMRANIVEKYAKLEQKAIEETAEAKARKIMDSYAVEDIKRNEQYSRAVNDLKMRYAKELDAAKGNSAEQERLRKKLDEDMYQLDVKYSQMSAEATINMLEEILANEELSKEERLKYEQDLAQAKIDLEGQMADAAKKAAEDAADADNDLRDQRLRNIEKWADKAKEAISYIDDIVDALYDRQISKVEDEQDANEAAGEKEQERITELVNKKVITQEEGEARKRAAEAQTAKKTEELEKKKAQLQYKQAVWEKANTIAQIGISTALAVMNAAQTKPFLPLGLAMTTVASTMGALQLAAALATPIPKYAKGTDFHPGGPAIVGDGGRQEVILFKNTAWLTPDKPTLVDIPVGSQVIPDYSSFVGDTLNLMTLETPVAERPQVIVNNDYTELRREMKAVGDLIRLQTKMQKRAASDREYELFKLTKL